MRNIKIRNNLSIALLLLIGLFVIGGIMVETAIGNGDCFHPVPGVDVEICITREGPLENEGQMDEVGQDWDIDWENMSAWLYVTGYRVDDDGNTLGCVTVSGGACIIEDEDGNWKVNYYATASSFLLFADQGVATAWVELPGRDRVDHAPNGDPMQVGGGNERFAGAWDNHTINFNNAGGRTAEASATLEIDDVEIEVGYSVTGI